MASTTGCGQAIGRNAEAGGMRSRACSATILAATIIGLAASPAWSTDDPRDATFLAPVLQRVLETARTDVEIPWQNPATGNRGTIVVERTFYREPDTPCRTFVRTLEVAGAAPQVTTATGCRSSTGLWTIEEDPAPAAGPARGAPPASTATGSPRRAPAPDSVAEAGPTCPDTVLVPMPASRPPAFAYTLPSRAEL